MPTRRINDIFGQSLTVINVGLESMAESLRDQAVPVIHLDWRPPAEGVPRLAVTKTGVDIDAANEEVCARIRGGRPVLVGMGIARDVIPGMHDRLILHAGPPITWERMCGPQRGAVMGALVYGGIAQDEAEAERIAASGGVEFSPCHHHHAVGPMAGVIYIQIDPQTPLVWGNARALEQVFTNLVTNAIQALSEKGGTITLKIRPATNGAGRKYVEIDVVDNGPGIPKEFQDRIFLPFFTTKPTGTGLGLAITKHIITAHKGDIQLSSVPGGTVFQVHLPATEGQ